MTINDSQWPSERVAPKKLARKYDINVFSNLAAQVFFSHQATLSDPTLKCAQATANTVQACPPMCTILQWPPSKLRMPNMESI